jgi:hypothetical protein
MLAADLFIAHAQTATPARDKFSFAHGQMEVVGLVRSLLGGARTKDSRKSLVRSRFRR